MSFSLLIYTIILTEQIILSTKLLNIFKNVL
ncbi:hypothetical protein C5L23_000565 [Leuconostoc fallax]|uniref:Uncharacterized protein n=1 Tax=Leuconostoc fallax TaxID=1251 RepID=A0A4R5N8J5_9LACO|nr:hypothetical protein C5L23_000565 [Leuconostoc fallax]